MRKFLLAGVFIGSVAIFSHHAAVANPVTLVPAAAFDAPLAKAHGNATAILSGGCFWGMQAVFQHVKGVREVTSGYTGGAANTASYDDVSTGSTGHAESVQIQFDPSVISYGTILHVYFSVATDPTELNQQFPDDGPQYRGEIWAADAAQRRIATAYISQLSARHSFATPIVTRIDPEMPFYPAEAYHQNYATLNPDSPYIAAYYAPKVTALAALFPSLYLASPVLLPPGAS